MVTRPIVYLAALLMFFALPLYADDATGPLLKQLNRIFPSESPDSVVATPVKGLYEVTYGADIFYVTEDGRYLMQGDVIDLDQKVNLTEKKRSIARKQIISAIDEKTTIIFAPKNVKHVVTVFTDVDCTYCRKMHSQIAEYNDLGIEIRYLAYPRSGANTPSYFKAVAVWCAEDRKAALTAAKSGAQVGPKDCDNPVLQHMEMAGKIGLSGTPTLILEDGSMMPGYVPPLQLSKFLEDL